MAKDKKDGWTIHGINLTTSDAIYQKVHELIQAGDLNPIHICGAAGHKGPVDINPQTKEILFRSF